MKIAYFTDTYTPEVNGVTNTLTKLSGYLEKKGIAHSFFAPNYEDTPADGRVSLQEMIKIHRYPGIRLSISPASCLTFPRTREIFDQCDRFSPDIVHVITELGIGYKGMKYAQSRKVPLVMSYHTDYCKYLNYYNLSPLEPMADMYLKWFYNFSQRTLVPSSHTLEQLTKKGYGNLGIWSRGVDTEKFSLSHRSEEERKSLGLGSRFAFLYVGRLSPEKGLHMLLHSIEKINSLLPGKAAFIFTGDGPFSDNIRQAGFDNVVMTGFKKGPELSRIYASCDCFAFPSGTETFGNAPLEAMASGLPVVGVSSGGVTEFLTHGVNSLLCTDGDEGAYCENLLRVMRDAQLRRSLSESGLETARSRGWDRIFDGLLKEYEAVIREHPTNTFIHAS